MNRLNNLKERIKECFSHRTITVTIAGILIFLSTAAFIIFLFHSCDHTKNSRLTEETQQLVPDQPLLIPEGPALPDGYVTTRKPRPKWEKEDASQWFTKPDSGNIEELEKANDTIISDIVGAAP